MIPCFKLSFNQTILNNQVTIGRYDGYTPCLTCVCSTGKIFVHDRKSEKKYEFLNINREIRCITAGDIKNSSTSSDLLFIGSSNNLLCYDVTKNSDLFYLDIKEGIESLDISELSFLKKRVVFVGSNCNISAFDHEGSEQYWNSVGGKVSKILVIGDYLIVGSDDFCIYIYKEETMTNELSETNIVNGLTDLHNNRFGFSLIDGSIGIYENFKRIWKKKSKYSISSFGSYDLSQDGKKDLIVGFSNGKLMVRNQKKGKLIYSDKFNSQIESILVDDYKQNGKKILIACSNNGEVRGYLGEQIKKYISNTNSIDEEIEELKQKKQKLQFEIENYSKNIKEAKGGKNDPDLISHKTQVKCRLKPNPVSKTVDIIFESSNDTIIKLAIIKADNLFDNKAKLFYSKDPKNVIVIGLRPEKDCTINLNARVLVGHDMAANFHVFQLSYNMPKFSMYVPVRFFENDQNPQSYVMFKLSSRISRIGMWLNSSFNIVYKNENKDNINVRFISLRNGMPLHILYKNGKMLIKIDDLEIAGDLIHDLTQKLNVTELNSIVQFDGEIEKLTTNLRNIDEYNSTRLKLTTEMIDISNTVKNLIIMSENNRLLGNMERLRSNYTKLMDFNNDLVNEFTKRSYNQKQLLESLKIVNLIIQRSSRVRVGTFKTKLVAEIRNCIKKKNYEGLSKIIKFGVTEEN